MARSTARSAGGAARHRAVTLPGRGTLVVSDGAGPPGAPALLLLHGATLNAELNWSGALEVLSREHRVVAFDQRGHADGLPAPVFALEDCADDAAAVATALGIERFVAVGYSMGGLVAQLLWRRHRDRVDGLVLAATTRNVCGSPGERSIAVLLPSAIASVTLFPSLYPLGADLIGSSLLDYDLTPAQRRLALTHMRRTTLRDALAAAHAVSGFTSHTWIGDVDVPTAVVITRHDRIVPPARQWKLARAIPHSTVVEVDGDHGVFLRHPGRFAAALDAACGAVTAEAGRFAGGAPPTAS